MGDIDNEEKGIKEARKLGHIDDFLSKKDDDCDVTKS